MPPITRGVLVGIVSAAACCAVAAADAFVAVPLLQSAELVCTFRQMRHCERISGPSIKSLVKWLPRRWLASQTVAALLFLIAMPQIPLHYFLVSVHNRCLFFLLYNLACCDCVVPQFGMSLKLCCCCCCQELCQPNQWSFEGEESAVVPESDVYVPAAPAAYDYS